MALRPSASVTAHWANVKDTDAFPLSFFRGFRIVLNALDNIGADGLLGRVDAYFCG